MSHEPIPDWDKGVKAIGDAFAAKPQGSFAGPAGSAGDATKTVQVRKVQSRPLYWTWQEAKGDVDEKQCIHGIPLNVFCDKCEN